MCKNITLVICCLVALMSCKNSEETQELTAAKGNRYYGGILRISKSEYLRSLYPPSIIDPVSASVASQIYDGLFYYDANNHRLNPCLLKKYEVSADSMLYTFYLKEKVFFHDDVCFTDGKGRELTAQDIAYCFTRLCTQSPDNQGYYIFKDKLKGANQYYTSSANSKFPSTGIEGIRIINKYTLQLILDKPSPELPMQLALPLALIYPKEAIQKYGTLRTKGVGTGPFVLEEVERDISLALKRNLKYHRTDAFGNRLPLLDGINFQYIPDKNSELANFKHGNVHVMYHFPTDQFLEILNLVSDTSQQEWKNTVLVHTPEMTTYMMVFNFKKDPFKNISLRKAFAYSIDKSILLGTILRGEGNDIARHGIVPPLYKNYPITRVNSTGVNTDSARFYMEKSNIPPSLTLSFYADGSRNTLVAISIAEQIKNTLGIEINLEPQSLAKFYDNVLEGKFDLVLMPKTAQIPMPENFLEMFYGKNITSGQKSYPNFSHYQNIIYDRLYIQKPDSTHSETPLSLAEDLLIQHAAVIPLWYDEGYYLLHKNVKNFPINSMATGIYTEVYFSPHSKPIQ